jgi:hypothetical protein
MLAAMNQKTINPNLPQSGGRRVLFVLAIISGLATLYLQSFISGVLNDISMAHFLQVQFSWNLAGFEKAMGLLGDGAKAYTTHLWWDMVYPFAYATFLYCTVSLLLTPKPAGLNLLPAYRRAWALESFRRLRRFRNLRFLPVIAGAADLTENVMTLYLLSPDTLHTDTMVLACLVCTLVKWFFLAGSVIAGVYALLVQYMAKHGRRG